MSEHRNFFVGIDLGTTNSAIAWGRVDPRGEQVIPKVIEVEQLVEGGSASRRPLLSSAVYFGEGKTPVVGPLPDPWRGGRPGGWSGPSRAPWGPGGVFAFDGRNYDPAEVSALILGHLAQGAKKLLGFLPEDVVITVPASFDSDMRQATVDAAAKAGFRVTEPDGSPRNILLDEPRAALFDFVNRQTRGEIPEDLVDFTRPKNVLVFDLGGGTLDVSLHKVRRDDAGGLKVEDYAISRYTRIGGDDFDRLVATRFLEAFGRRVSLEGLGASERAALEQRFLSFAEEAKRELVNEQENRTVLGVRDGEDLEVEVLQARVLGDHPFEYRLSFREFEEILSPLLGEGITLEGVDRGETGEGETLMTPVVDVLLKTRDRTGELPRIDVVLLNGGMTRLSTVRDRLRRFFGVEPLCAGDPDLAVVRGAVAYHYHLHRGGWFGGILNDTIGIEVAGGRVRPIVAAGTALPFRSEVIRDFVVHQDGASFVDLPFFLGRRTDTQAPNRRIASRRVRFPRPLAAGEVLCLQVEVDERSIMTLKGWPEGAPGQAFQVTLLSDGSRQEEPQEAPGEEPSGSFRMNALRRAQEPPKGEALPVEPTLRDLQGTYQEFLRAAGDPSQSGVANRIRCLERRILGASNGGDFVAPLGRLLTGRSPGGYARPRWVFLLGELGMRHPRHRQEVARMVRPFCTLQAIQRMLPTQVNTLARYAVEALGKVGDGSEEPLLLDLLRSRVAQPLWAYVLYALGKTGKEVGAFQKALGLCSSDQVGVRQAALWCLGMMGSRERNLVPPAAVVGALGFLAEGVEREPHKDALRNILFALGELGDRRPGRASVDGKVADKVLRALGKARLRVQRGRFDNLVVLQRFCDLAEAMVKGRGLSAEQERNLLGLRSLLSVPGEAA